MKARFKQIKKYLYANKVGRIALVLLHPDGLKDKEERW